MKTNVNIVAVGIWLAASANGLTQPAIIQFTSSKYSVSENNNATIAVEITGAEPGLSYTVDYAASGGTATGEDYSFVPTLGTVLFSSDATNQSLPVFSIHSDCLREGTETVHLTLSNPSPNAVLGVRGNAVLEIRDANAEPLDSWTTRRFGVDVGLADVAYGNGLYVAVGNDYRGWGSNGVIYTSSDGLAWTLGNLEMVPDLHCVAFGNSIFVAAGNDGTILTSPDGLVWTRRSLDDTNVFLNDIAYGNGLFVAVGSDVLTSPDGVTWTSRSVPTNICDFTFVQRIAYGDGIFVAVDTPCGGDLSVLLSTNGANWTRLPTGSTQPSYGRLAYGNGTFVLLGYKEGYQFTILTSPNGITWVRHALAFFPWWAPFVSLGDVAFGNGMFVAVGGGSFEGTWAVIATSPDGVNWTNRNRLDCEQSAAAPDLSAVTYGAGRFVGVGFVFSRGWHTASMRSGDVTQARLVVNGAPSDAGFELVFSGEVGRAYRLQATTDFAQWTDLLTFALTQPATNILDTTAISFRQRFYRAVLIPE